MDEMFKLLDAKLFMSYPVRNYTFAGIFDEIMEGVETFPDSLVVPIPFDKFGWFYGVSCEDCKKPESDPAVYSTARKRFQL